MARPAILSLFFSARGSHAGLDWHLGLFLLRLGRPFLPAGHTSPADAPLVQPTLPARRVELYVLPLAYGRGPRAPGGSISRGFPVPRQGAALDQPRSRCPRPAGF